MLRSVRVPVVVAGLALSLCPSAAAQVPPPELTITRSPEVRGEPRVGAELTATRGEWTGGGPVVRTEYRWYRCTPLVTPNIAICSAATPVRTEPEAYTIGVDDVGYTLAIRLQVTDGTTTASVFSESTGRVVPRPPSNIEPPKIDGAAREGHLLRASPGDWRSTTPVTYAYRWERCRPSGTGCTPIAIGATYAIAAGDVGMRLRVGVTAENEGGPSPPAYSSLTRVVAPSRLVNLEPPAITGTAEVGATLRTTTGRWNDSGPLDFDIRWLRCGESCAPIAQATAATYAVQPRDVGFRLRVRVTATSDSDTSTSESALTPVVVGSVASRQSAPLVRMRPFPRVRIRGHYTSRGAVLNLVLVKRARGARIAITCHRAGCPFRRRARRAVERRVRLRSLERAYPARTRIVFRITAPLRIGKYTKVVIRAGRPPTRRDRCLMPDSPRPVRCATS